MLDAIKTMPQEEALAIANRAKELRLRHKFTQQGLAERSGVSLGSIKRFENSGKISLLSLLKIAFILDVMEDFTALFMPKVNHSEQSLDELIRSTKKRKRGVIS